MASAEVNFRTKVVLLDIEGTTTSIQFVKDVLYSYARENLRKYIFDNWESEEMKEVVRLLKKQYDEDVHNDCLPPPHARIPEGIEEQESIYEYVLWQMNLDRKTHSLKKLQGYIWRNGFVSGQLKGHIYEDVAPALKRWVENGLKLYVFSSGSVEAQRLHFGYSEKGNMLDLFSGHFDTSLGSKIEVSSYQKIAECIGEAPAEILFITDVIAEAEAAAAAGYEVIISKRDGNAPIPKNYSMKFKFIHTFDELDL